MQKLADACAAMMDRARDLLIALGKIKAICIEIIQAIATLECIATQPPRLHRMPMPLSSQTNISARAILVRRHCAALNAVCACVIGRGIAERANRDGIIRNRQFMTDALAVRWRPRAKPLGRWRRSLKSVQHPQGLLPIPCDGHGGGIILLARS